MSVPQLELENDWVPFASFHILRDVPELIEDGFTGARGQEIDPHEYNKISGESGRPMTCVLPRGVAQELGFELWVGSCENVADKPTMEFLACVLDLKSYIALGNDWAQR